MRTRVIRACERCHRLKCRCDPPETWPCSACARHQVPCVPRVGASNGEFGTGGPAFANGPSLDLSQLDYPTRDDHIRGLTKSVLPATDGSNVDRSYNATSSQRQGSGNEHLPWEHDVSGHLSRARPPPNSGLLDIGRNPAVDWDESSVMLPLENIVTAGTLEGHGDLSYPKHPSLLSSQDKTALRQATQMRLQSHLNSDRPDAKRYGCPSCSKSFTKKNHMLRHQRQRTSLAARRIARLTPSRCRRGALHLQFLLQFLQKKARSFPAGS